MCIVFFFQAEDGIRDLVRSRGLGDVYKRQAINFGKNLGLETIKDEVGNVIIRKPATEGMENRKGIILSLIHI